LKLIIEAAACETTLMTMTEEKDLCCWEVPAQTYQRIEGGQKALSRTLVPPSPQRPHASIQYAKQLNGGCKVDNNRALNTQQLLLGCKARTPVEKTTIWAGLKAHWKSRTFREAMEDQKTSIASSNAMASESPHED
jgi:hypothetical protein